MVRQKLIKNTPPFSSAHTQLSSLTPDWHAQITTSSTYDFNTGLILSATDANGKTSTTAYSATTLRPQSMISSTSSHCDYAYDDIAMTTTETTYVATGEGGGIADQTVKLLNGLGQVRQEKALGVDGVWDFVDIVYDNMGRVFQESQPYRSGYTRYWTTQTYDPLGRSFRTTAPDGSVAETYYNEKDPDTQDTFAPQRPNVATTFKGETALVKDAWGREHWGRTDASGRLVEVVEPNPLGGGSTANGGLVTTYGYDALGNLVTVNQGGRTRSFKYDSLGRLTAQKFAETSATLDDAGAYHSSGGTWSDVFRYDLRSNLIQRIDARGVKANYWYFDRTNYTDPGAAAPEPLNRLQAVSWEIGGGSSTPIISVAPVSYSYRTKSSQADLKDVTQLDTVSTDTGTTAGTSMESYVYDAEGRVFTKTLKLSNRLNYPMSTQYSYDTLDRVTDVLYPAEYGNGQTSTRKNVHHTYDIASRLSSLTVDNQAFASDFVYNAASQTTSLKVGPSGANQIVESYSYDPQTGLPLNQKVARSSAPTNYLLDLTYDYTNANGKRTGQLTKVLNNLNHNKDRGYTYDALGRLIQATGGPSGTLWSQTYGYDNFGNRLSVSTSGNSAQERGRPALNVVEREAEAAATHAIAAPTDPKVELPTDLLAKNNTVELPDALRLKEKSLLSDSPLGLYGSHVSRGNTSLSPQGPTNLALNKTATESSTFNGDRYASRAVDGNTDGALWDGYASATNYEYQPWWQVDLGSSQSLGSIEVWGRTDCCPEMTSNFYVLVSDQPYISNDLATARAQAGVSSYYVPGYSGTPGTISINRAGRYVRVQLAASQYLVLGEVKVFSATGSIPIPADGIGTLAYDSSNHITTSGFAYDEAGNQVRALAPGGASQRFKYDAANRLAQVLADDNTTVLASYAYSDSNERLISTEWGLRTYYVLEGGATIAEYFESGGATTPAWTKSYINIGRRLLATLAPNGSGGEAIQFHHPDRLGTRLVTNPSDGTYFEQVALPFGTPLSAESTGTTNRRFTSYDRSATTSLDHAVNRRYDAQQGRFTQVDPAGMTAVSLTSPQTLNLYAYCGNDPVNNADPSGLGFFSFIGKLFRSISKILAIILVVVVVVALVLIIVSPMGSAALAFGKFLFLKVAPLLANILKGTSGASMGGITLGPGGTAPWNPGRPTFFSSFQEGQQQIYTCEHPPDCQNDIPPFPQRWLPFPSRVQSGARLRETSGGLPPE